MKRRPGSPPVQSVVRALSLLEALASGNGEIGIAELGKRVGLHVSTAHRLLATLSRRGYVQQNPETGRYGLGPKAFHLSQAYLDQIELRKVARPFLERMREATGETANLVVLDQGEAFYLDKAESPQTLRVFTRIGHRAPLHCTAVGKALLAHMPEVQRRRYLQRNRLRPLTRNSITSRAALERELRRVRAKGYALDREECEEGACCVGVPVRNFTGEVVAAIGISGPATRLHPRRIEEVLPTVRATGAQVSFQLGYRPAVAHGRRAPAAGSGAP